MSTVLLFPENLSAMLTSSKVAQRQVDELMNGELTNQQNVYVWLDSGCYGNSVGKGYYYVRLHDPRQHCCSLYDKPDLIVKKSKLRQDQIDYMENKCTETKIKLSSKKS